MSSTYDRESFHKVSSSGFTQASLPHHPSSSSSSSSSSVYYTTQPTTTLDTATQQGQTAPPGAAAAATAVLQSYPSAAPDVTLGSRSIFAPPSPASPPLLPSPHLTYAPSYPLATTPTTTAGPATTPAATTSASQMRAASLVVPIIIRAGITKSKMAWWQTFILAMMSGLYATFGVLLLIIFAGSFSTTNTANTTGVLQQKGYVWDHATPNTTVATTAAAASYLQANTTVALTSVDTMYFGLGRLLAAATFPLAIILIVFTSSELFTGNIMYMTASTFLARQTSVRDLLRVWFFTYFGNFAGSLLFMYLLGYLIETVHLDPLRSYLISTVEKKVFQNWGIAFVKGCGCNLLVCMALWNNFLTDDLLCKLLALWWPCFTFVALGFEHCVANMVFIPLGMAEGANISIGQFIGRNLTAATLGNIVGGMFFIGVQYCCFYKYPWYAPAFPMYLPQSYAHKKKKEEEDGLYEPVNHPNQTKPLLYPTTTTHMTTSLPPTILPPPLQASSSTMHLLLRQNSFEDGQESSPKPAPAPSPSPYHFHANHMHPRAAEAAHAHAHASHAHAHAHGHKESHEPRAMSFDQPETTAVEMTTAKALPSVRGPHAQTHVNNTTTSTHSASETPSNSHSNSASPSPSTSPVTLSQDHHHHHHDSHPASEIARIVQTHTTTTTAATTTTTAATTTTSTAALQTNSQDANHHNTTTTTTTTTTAAAAAAAAPLHMEKEEEDMHDLFAAVSERHHAAAGGHFAYSEDELGHIAVKIHPDASQAPPSYPSSAAQAGAGAGVTSRKGKKHLH